MKYIIEVLQPENTGIRTKVYSSKESAIHALDSYRYHRPGQPVVALYKDENDESKALIAIGTSTDAYTLICENNSVSSTLISSLSADKVILDPIDITDLLSSTGPGCAKDSGANYDLMDGASRHFGWLGTTKSNWAVTYDENTHKFATNTLTVQKMFEAILNGTLSDSPTNPTIKLSLSTNGGQDYTENSSVTVRISQEPDIKVKMEVTNFPELDDSWIYTLGTTNVTSNITSGNGTYIYDYSYNEPSPGGSITETFIFKASKGLDVFQKSIQLTITNDVILYTVKAISGGNGTVSTTPPIYETGYKDVKNKPYSFTATADPAYNFEFKEWRKNGSRVEGDKIQLFSGTITENITFTAIFERIKNSITFIDKDEIGSLAGHEITRNVDQGTYITFPSLSEFDIDTEMYELDHWEDINGNVISDITTVRAEGDTNYNLFVKEKELPKWRLYDLDDWKFGYQTISALKNNASVNDEKWWEDCPENDESLTGLPEGCYFMPFTISEEYNLITNYKAIDGCDFEFYQYSPLQQKWNLYPNFEKDGEVYKDSEGIDGTTIYAIKIIQQ